MKHKFFCFTNLVFNNKKELEYLASYISSTKCKTSTESPSSTNKNANLNDANSSAKRAVLSTRQKKFVFKSNRLHP
jgi:hypothetical protein